MNRIKDDELFYNMFIDHVAIMFVLDPANGNVIEANKSASKFYGYSLEQLNSMNISYINTDTLLDVKKRMNDIISGEKKCIYAQHRLSNGEVRDVEIHASAIHFKDEIFLFGIVHDITDRYKAEKELLESEDKYKKLNDEKDKFFSIVAHDLRSPFNGFLGLLQVLDSELATMNFNDIQKYIGILLKSAKNVFALLENLLEWSRLQQGTMEIIKTTFPLSNVIPTIELNRSSAINKQINLDYNIPPIDVFADFKMLESIIRNLISNAIKFTSSGGYVDINTNLLDHRVEISVKDTGIGMPKDMVDNLFSIDIKNKRLGTDGELSTGIGLLLVKEFVEKNNGTLKVESQENKGTTFTFSIPIAVQEFFSYTQEKLSE